MKKLRNLVGLIAVLSMAAIMTGCGDDDDDDDDVIIITRLGPQNQGELTASANVYTVTVGTNAPATFQFTGDGTGYTLTDANGTETGTISNIQATETSAWTFTTTPANGNPPSNVTLRFTSANAGVIEVLEQGATSPETGTFTLSGGGTTTGSTTGSTTGQTTGSTTGNPNDLSGKTLQLTYTSGGERFTFNSATAGTYENGNAVTYQYDDATKHLVINGGPNANSQYDMTLSFNAGSSTAGTTTVNYSENGQLLSTDQATFTLQ